MRDYQHTVNKSVIKFKTFAPLRLCGEYLCLLILISYNFFKISRRDNLSKEIMGVVFETTLSICNIIS